MTLQHCVAAAFLALAFLTGCGGGGIEYSPLTKSETLMFSDSIKEAIEFYDLSFFLGHQDKSRLRQRTEARGEAARAPGNVSGLFLDQFDLADGVLVGDPTQGTHWTYINQNRIFVHHPPDSSSLIQIRVHDSEFRQEYYTFLVESRKSSRGAKAVISDYFVHTTGEWISETAYEMAALEAAMNALPEAEQDRVNKVLENAGAMIDEGRHLDAELALMTLPESFLKRRGPAQLWLEASIPLGERSFEAAISNYRAAFPEDPKAALTEFERSFGLGRFQAAMASLDEVEEILGGPDAYLLNVRGVVWDRMEQTDSAAASFKRAVELEPDFPLPFISLFYHGLEQSDYPTTIQALKGLQVLGYKLEDFDISEYPAFLNSSEFQAYVAGSEFFPGDEKEVEEKGRAEGSRENADG